MESGNSQRIRTVSAADTASSNGRRRGCSQRACEVSCGSKQLDDVGMRADAGDDGGLDPHRVEDVSAPVIFFVVVMAPHAA